MARGAMIGIVAWAQLLLDPGRDARAAALPFPPIAGEIEVGMIAAAIDELAEDRRGAAGSWCRRSADPPAT